MALNVRNCEGADNDSVCKSESGDNMKDWGDLDGIPDIDPDLYDYLKRDTRAEQDMVTHDELVDPQHEKFMASVKEDGFSFILEPNEYNGLTKPLKYGGKDGSDGEEDNSTLGKLNYMTGENTDHIVNLHIDTEVEGGENPNFPPEKEDHTEEFHIHPEVEGAENPGFPLERETTEVVIENDVFSERISPIPSSCERSPMGKSHPDRPTPLVESHPDSPSKFDMQGGGSMRRQEELHPISNGPSKYKMPSGSAKRQKTRALGKLQCVTDGQDESEESTRTDEDFAEFIRAARFEGSKVTYVSGDVQFTYNATEDQSMSQTNDSGSFLEGDSTNLIHEQEVDPSSDGDESVQYLGCSSSKKQSAFKSQIMRELKKPFNSEELEKLMKAITARKPKERHVDLRDGRSRSFAVNKEGKSLVEVHPDLRQKLEATQDVHKKLNLLRGFFFWMKRACREGAFCPWNNPACLDM